MIALQAGVDGVRVDPTTLLNVIAILAGAYLIARLARIVLSGAAERSVRYRISIKMFIPIVMFVVYGVAVYLVVGPLLSLSSTQLLAVSGLFGAALGLGLKDLFAGVVGGLVIITERPYQVGDKVTIDDHYGEVTGIGLRATTLTTPDDTDVLIPNATLFTESVANANDGRPEMLVVVDVAVAPGADVDRARGVVADALVTSRYVYLDEDHSFVVLVEDETYYRRIRGKAYVADLRDEFLFASDVTERTLAAFDERGIETPEIPPGAPTDGQGG